MVNCLIMSLRRLLEYSEHNTLDTVYTRGCCVARPVTMSINHITGGGGLGSESAGTI